MVNYEQHMGLMIKKYCVIAATNEGDQRELELTMTSHSCA